MKKLATTLIGIISAALLLASHAETLYAAAAQGNDLRAVPGQQVVAGPARHHFGSGPERRGPHCAPGRLQQAGDRAAAVHHRNPPISPGGHLRNLRRAADL